MMFSYEQKVILNFWIKNEYGATRIVNDHLEYKSKVTGERKLMKKIGRTSEVALKCSGWFTSVRTE